MLHPGAEVMLSNRLSHIIKCSVGLEPNCLPRCRTGLWHGTNIWVSCTHLYFVYFPSPNLPVLKSLGLCVRFKCCEGSFVPLFIQGFLNSSVLVPFNLYKFPICTDGAQGLFAHFANKTSKNPSSTLIFIKYFDFFFTAGGEWTVPKGLGTVGKNS